MCTTITGDSLDKNIRLYLVIYRLNREGFPLPFNAQRTTSTWIIGENHKRFKAPIIEMISIFLFWQEI